MEEFRGELVATMVYDGQPMHDHFKKVDDNTVMGIMNGKHALKTGTLRLLLPRTRLVRWVAAGVGDQPVQRAGVGGHVDRIVEARRSTRPSGVMIFFAKPMHVVGQRLRRLRAVRPVAAA